MNGMRGEERDRNKGDSKGGAGRRERESGMLQGKEVCEWELERGGK